MSNFLFLYLGWDVVILLDSLFRDGFFQLKKEAADE